MERKEMVKRGRRIRDRQTDREREREREEEELGARIYF